MSTHHYDPEFAAAASSFLSSKLPTLTTASEIRALNEHFLPTIMAAVPAHPSTTQTHYTITSYDKAPIQITHFISSAAKSSSTPLPAILFIHGGAMLSGSVATYAPQISYLAHRTGYPVFGVDWRLAPEHPAPIGLEDCYAALTWLSQHAEELGVDCKRLVVMGDSAGGLLSASTALVARDRGLSPPLAKQVLIYPTLDDRVVFPEVEGDGREELLLWKHEWSRIAWGAYLGGDEKVGRDEGDVPVNVVPQRVQDLRGLPSTYLDVGTLDMFMDEGMEYAKRLVSAGVEVELHVLPGLPHGWEMAGQITWFERMMQLRVDAIKRV